MNALAGGPIFGRRGGLKGLAWFGGLVATVAAAVIGAILAVFFAATLTVIALLGGALLATAGWALRARRLVRARGRPGQSDVIEARHMGGHSWVAYGWDRSSR